MTSPIPPRSPETDPSFSPHSLKRPEQSPTHFLEDLSAAEAPGRNDRAQSFAKVISGETMGHATKNLAQAASLEHSFTPWQAIRTYWKAFGWCM